MKNIFILLFLCAYISPGYAKQDTETHEMADISLQQAIELTLQYSPLLKEYNYNIEIARINEKQAGIGVRPELDIEVENFGGNKHLKAFNSAETTLQLNQQLLLGNKTALRQQVSSYRTKIEETAYLAQRLSVIQEVTQNYIEALYMAEKAAIAKEQISNSMAIKAMIEKRVNSGKDSPLAIAKAAIDNSRALLEYQNLENRLKYSKTKLQNCWQPSPDGMIAINGDLDVITEILSQNILLAKLENNPEMINWASEVQMQIIRGNLANAQALPDITISGGLKHINESDSTAFIVGLSIPLNSSKYNKNLQKEAQTNISKVQTQKEAAYNWLVNEFNRSYMELENAIDRVKTIKETILSDSEKLFNASITSYENGKTSYLDLLDSQKILFSAKDDYIDALAEYHIIKTKIECLIGESLNNN